MNWRLRRAEWRDARPLRELVLRAYAHYPRRIGARPAPMEGDYEREIADKELWVAAEEERLGGVLVLRRAPGHLFVDNVAVAPESQGEGLRRAKAGG